MSIKSKTLMSKVLKDKQDIYAVHNQFNMLQLRLANSQANNYSFRKGVGLVVEVNADVVILIKRDGTWTYEV